MTRVIVSYIIHNGVGFASFLEWLDERLGRCMETKANAEGFINLFTAFCTIAAVGWIG